MTQIAAGDQHAVVVCDDNNLYSWGVGLYGILGNGTNDYALSPVLNEEFAYLRSASEESG